MTYRAEPDAERASAEEASEAPPLSEAVGALLEAARQFVRDVGELLGLEAQRAFQALTWMAALAVGAGLLGAGAWFLLLAAAYTVLIDWGMAGGAVFLLLAGLNLLGAIMSAVIIRRMSKALLFRATCRVLLGEPNHAPAKPQNTGT
ncbi:MAG: phage holin family protein [Nitrococcus mobilis]|nr:phage holin family protein [Nitrococcus mobilis]